MMGRAGEVYIKRDTRRALALIAKVRNDGATLDQVADEALAAWIAKEHAEVVRIISEQDRLVKEYLKAKQAAEPPT